MLMEVQKPPMFRRTLLQEARCTSLGYVTVSSMLILPHMPGLLCGQSVHTQQNTVERLLQDESAPKVFSVLRS